MNHAAFLFHDREPFAAWSTCIATVLTLQGVENILLDSRHKEAADLLMRAVSYSGPVAWEEINIERHHDAQRWHWLINGTTSEQLPIEQFLYRLEGVVDPQPSLASLLQIFQLDKRSNLLETTAPLFEKWLNLLHICLPDPQLERMDLYSAEDQSAAQEKNNGHPTHGRP